MNRGVWSKQGMKYCFALPHLWLVIIAVALTFAVNLLPKTAFACMSRSQPLVEKAFAQADAVFIGETAGSVEQGQMYIAIVNVIDSWKGVDTSAIAIYSSSFTSCSSPLPEGKFLIFAHKQNGQFFSNGNTDALSISDLTKDDWAFLNGRPKLELKGVPQPDVPNYHWRIFLKRLEFFKLWFYNPLWYVLLLIIWSWWNRLALHYLRKRDMAAVAKALWAIVIIILPLLGATVFWLASPRNQENSKKAKFLAAMKKVADIEPPDERDRL
jgi:hypothetical protein